MSVQELSVDSIWAGYVPVANVVGGFATGIAAGLAIAALIVAIWQVRKSAAASREAEAQQTYNDYLRMCIEYPELSSEKLALTHLKLADFSGIEDIETRASEQYLWFVSFMLNACEKILLCTGDVGPWRSAISAQISYHRACLDEVWEGWSSHYSKAMRDIVDEELK